MDFLLVQHMLLLVLNGVFAHQKYRFDYEWSDAAGGWLKYHEVPAVWEEARLRCHAEGAVLASPLTNSLNDAIVQFATKHNALDVFIGVHCTFSKGDYSSVEGVPLRRLAFTWAPGEPNNLDNAESCLKMLFYEASNGNVADTRCDNVLPYICYKKNTTISLTTCGTTDPGYIYEPRTGSCYKFHRTGLFWSEAYKTCVGEGGYLAIIDNEEEAKAIVDFLNQYLFGTDKELTFVNIGFHDWGHYNTNFMTIHGESLEGKYMVWRANEPNNITLTYTNDFGEHCGSMDRDGKLNDMSCHLPKTFLCEMKPYSLQ